MSAPEITSCEDPACTADHHGTASARRRGCTSETARLATNRELRARRKGIHQPRFVAALGLTRRLRALSALGHTTDELSRELDVAGHLIRAIRGGRYPRVHVDTARKIVRGYARLEGTPGSSAKTRSRSKTQGYAPPLAWDDIDDPAERPKFWAGQSKKRASGAANRRRRREQTTTPAGQGQS